jgi:ribonuclease VapC
MVVDTSALIAILFGEADSEIFVQTLALAPAVYVSAATVVEASVVALGRDETLDIELTHLLKNIGVVIVPVDEIQVEIARSALKTSGKGRHKAHLNLGDSFAYALATHRGEPLLFKGDDFAKTDVKQAL